MMNLKYFNDFVNEAKETKIATIKNPRIKLVILTNASKESHTVPSFEEECKKKGIEFGVIDINSALLSDSGNGNFILSDSNNKKGIKINSDNTAILTRRGVVRNTYTRSLVETLEDNNFFVVNTLESILACENKYVTTRLLQEAGIPVPKTAIVDSEESIEKGLKIIGGKFPVVVKILSGSQGIGVSIVDSLASLKSVLQTLWKVNPTVEILIQEKIESEYDLRIHVLTRKFNSPTPEKTDSVLLGYMRRNRVKKDFRTNYSLGGSVEKTKVTPEQEEIAINAAKVVGCNWCGVDIIVDKKTGKNYVLEVNASPGTTGLKKATGVNVVKDIVEFLLDKSNWIRSRKRIGFREVITIPGIGDIVAKFDTGNGSLSCTMTYDKIDIDEKGKEVKWSLNGRDFTSKFMGYTETEVGDDLHKRPVIEIDIQFAGKIYKKVPVALDDRSGKSTKFLVNRKFMERIGCSVDPMRTFIVTSFNEEYHAGDAKKDKYAGILFDKK
jgi:ribosomal protein S6--L-glutamate ligase